MKKMKVFAALAAAVTALNALCIPAAAKDTEDMTPEERTAYFVENMRARYGPFYALGEDVSAYEPGDITMDGKVDLKDCLAIQLAYNYIVLLEEDNYLTEAQMQLGDVFRDGQSDGQFPINLRDVKTVLRFLNFRDLLEEPITMAESAAMLEKKTTKKSEAVSESDIPNYGGAYTLSPEELSEIQQKYGPFYTLGTDVSAYEPGDITMDGEVNETDVHAIMSAFNYVVLDESRNYLTADQIQLGNVCAYEGKFFYPINFYDANVLSRFLVYRDLQEKPRTMEETAAIVEQKRLASSEKKS